MKKKVNVKHLLMKRIVLYMSLIFLLLPAIGCSLSKNDKPLRDLFISFKANKKYNVSDEITVTIYYGTTITKHTRDYSKPVWDNPTDGYKAEISIVNKHYIQSTDEETNFLFNPQNVEERILITTFDDFYEENYPLFIRRRVSGCFSYETVYNAPSHIDYILPKSLFLDESGTIVIGIKAFTDVTCAKLYYKIDGDTIYINDIYERD